jgi:hypothetical protein
MVMGNGTGIEAGGSNKKKLEGRVSINEPP